MSVDSAANTTTGLLMGEFLIPKTSDLGDRHFIIRSLYKKTYTDAILQIKLICRYICHRSILLYVYVYELRRQLRLTTVFKE